MLLFATLIIISLMFYIFYKVRYYRTRMPMERKWLSGKSSIALGLFVALFGINQLFLYQTTTTYLVSAIFIVFGGLSIWNGFKMYKFYLPHAIKEAEHAETQA
ncbi:YtpI family protein [Peribacillus sp. SCS-155]|uniref:YtpI family protein n=1 Tax=Peribacillus sedimenti TaxID=3115297 RepID=UPI00390674DB